MHCGMCELCQDNSEQAWKLTQRPKRALQRCLISPALQIAALVKGRHTRTLKQPRTFAWPLIISAAWLPKLLQHWQDPIKQVLVVVEVGVGGRLIRRVKQERGGGIKYEKEKAKINCAMFTAMTVKECCGGTLGREGHKRRGPRSRMTAVPLPLGRPESLICPSSGFLPANHWKKEPTSL